MKKYLSFFLIFVMLLLQIFSFSSCSKNSDDVKIGIILLNNDSSFYDLSIMNSAKAAAEKLGLKASQLVFKKEVPETRACYDAAADLIDSGCNIIVATALGHEEWMLKAANEYKDIHFCVIGGRTAHTNKLDNFHNAYPYLFEGTYLTGVVAGLKLNEKIENGEILPTEAILGYVASLPSADTISAYSAFYLGAKSVCGSATMMVGFTNSHFSLENERTITNNLIDRGAVLISYNTHSEGPSSVCNDRSIPSVSFLEDLSYRYSNTVVSSVEINWTPYFEFLINSIQNKSSIPYDWFGGIQSGAVVIPKINESISSDNTLSYFKEIKAKLVNREIKVFDTSTFTVGNKEITSYLADVHDLGDHTGDTEVIINSIFEESKYRSAPYFDLAIDGIIRLDKE